MTTAKQISANRENGKKGGPKTVGGRLASSKNALKHGILSAETALPGENQEELDGLREYVIADLKPHGPVQEFRALRIVALMVALARVERAEQFVLENGTPQGFWNAMSSPRWHLLQRYRTQVERRLDIELGHFAAEQAGESRQDETRNADVVHPQRGQRGLDLDLGDETKLGECDRGRMADTDETDEQPATALMPLASADPPAAGAPRHYDAAFVANVGTTGRQHCDPGERRGPAKSSRCLKIADFLTAEERARILQSQGRAPDSSSGLGATVQAEKSQAPSRGGEPVAEPQYLTSEMTLGAWRQMKQPE